MERFWAKVHKGDVCWEWIAGKDRYGYGKFCFRGHDVGAHRVAWTLTYGAIPTGLFVCHHCDNRGCVRPDHLFLGSNKENMADAKSKGRIISPFRPNEEHCNVKYSNALIQQVRDAYNNGKRCVDIAADLGIHRNYIYLIVHTKRRLLDTGIDPNSSWLISSALIDERPRAPAMRTS